MYKLTHYKLKTIFYKFLYRKLGLELVPRDGSRAVQPGELGAVKLYRVHLSSSKSVNVSIITVILHIPLYCRCKYNLFYRPELLDEVVVMGEATAPTELSIPTMDLLIYGAAQEPVPPVAELRHELSSVYTTDAAKHLCRSGS